MIEIIDNLTPLIPLSLKERGEIRKEELRSS